MKTGSRLSEAEWEIMKVIWKQDSCSAQAVIDELASTTSWTSSTIKTLLNRLLSKGALRFKKIGKSYLYSAVWNEEQCRTREATSFLDRVFDGEFSPMLAHFVRTRRLSREDLRELERVLKGHS
jgi:BlaI family penicillinase repressor